MRAAIFSCLSIAVALVASNALAQSSGPVVAVIDVAKVFKHHDGFKAKMDAVQAEAKEYEKYLNDQRTGINQQKETQDEYSPSSEEYKRLDQAMAKKVSDLQVAMTLKRKEFVTRETAIYYETYGQIQAAVEKIATQYGISLVLRYDSEQMEEDNRPSVQKGVANPVVYQRNLDLTAMVIESLKR